jgi:hypothetical protein
MPPDYSSVDYCNFRPVGFEYEFKNNHCSFHIGKNISKRTEDFLISEFPKSAFSCEIGIIFSYVKKGQSVP